MTSVTKTPAPEGAEFLYHLNLVAKDGPIDVILTRPAAQSRAFAKDLRAAAQARGIYARILIAPVMEIVPRSDSYFGDALAGVIFTSEHGVRFAPPATYGVPAYCVGARTADRARSAGHVVAHVAQTADDLIAQLSGQMPAGQIVHVCGAHHRGDIAERLSDHQTQIARHIVYDQEHVPLTAAMTDRLNAADAVVVALFSPRSAELFMKQGPYRAPISCAVMSEAVQKSVEHFGAYPCTVAHTPTRAHMLEAVLAAGDTGRE